MEINVSVDGMRIFNTSITSVPVSYVMDTSNYTIGNYTVSVVIRDNSGAEISTTLTLEISDVSIPPSTSTPPPSSSTSQGVSSSTSSPPVSSSPVQSNSNPNSNTQSAGDVFYLVYAISTIALLMIWRKRRI